MKLPVFNGILVVHLLKGDGMSNYVRNKFYREMLAYKPKWGPIGQIVYLRTYSRWLQDQGRREHWGETVRRVADYSVTLDPTMTEEERVIEAEKLFETVYKMRAFPAGRTLWVGGTEHSKTHGQSQFNCSFANINSLDDLHDIVILLMNGVGVGVGVRTEEVDKFASQGTLNLNKQVVIKDYEYIGEPGTGGEYHKSDGSAYYTIHDSREGWAEFVRDFLRELLFTQDTHTIYVNLDHIRPEGAPLKTFGGRASGPKAIIDFIDGILKISHGMTKINDIFLLDTANMLGRMVIAGGVRRSALIALGDAASEDFENAKIGDWWKDYPWREQANNSKVFYSKPTKESIKEGFKKILQYGEPAFVNGIMAKSIRRDWAGLNPCLTGDTLVPIYGRGLVYIRDLKDQVVKIRDGNGDATESLVRKTSDSEPILKITLSDGSSYKVTPYHEFPLSTGEKVKAKDLKNGDQLISADIVGMFGTAHDPNQAYLDAWLYADGTWHGDKRSSKLYLYEPKHIFKDRLEECGAKFSTIDRNGRLIAYFPRRAYNKTSIPDYVLQGDEATVLSYVKGIFDSDGYVSDKPGAFQAQVLSIRPEWLAQFQMLLRLLGINSTIDLYKAAGETDFGPSRGGIYKTKEIFRLSVTNAAMIVKYLMPESLKRGPYNIKRNISVKSVEDTGLTEEVYCIGVPTTATFDLPTVHSGNCAEILLSDKGFCNLVTTNLKYFAEHGNDEQMLKDTVEIITRHNLRITNTTIHGVSPQWDIVQKRDRLLGVSFTGYGDHADILGEDVSLETLGKMRKWVREQANNYADKMGIPHPLLATTVKPEGTITLLYGASSGIHDAYAPFYIRRMRMSRTDALAVVLAKMGVPVEDAINAPQTVVFSFPVKTAAKQAASKKSAVEQLERYKNIMQTYVDHNASNTIYLDESEVDQVTDWLYDNWDSYVAVSFLAKFGQYEQAPMEEIDEETYNKLAAQMPDLSDLHARLAEVEYEMSAGDELEGCDTGSCPIR